MSYNILGINPFHNGSVCLLSDGKVVYYLEEERLTRDKNDANPFRVILDVINKFKIDEVVIGGIDSNSKTLGFSDEDPFYSLIRKYLPEIKDYKTCSLINYKDNLKYESVLINFIETYFHEYEMTINKNYDQILNLFKNQMSHLGSNINILLPNGDVKKVLLKNMLMPLLMILMN